jgi:hypothetical protein
MEISNFFYSLIDSVPGIIKAPLGEDHKDDRKKQSLHKSDPGKCMVRSIYFSKEVDDISMKEQDTGRPMATSGDYISTQSPKTARNATRNVDVELSKDLGKPIVNAAMDVGIYFQKESSYYNLFTYIGRLQTVVMLLFCRQATGRDQRSRRLANHSTISLLAKVSKHFTNLLFVICIYKSKIFLN